MDAVRATGGNNAQRTLVVQGPSTDITLATKDAFTLPTDAAEKRLMVEVHFYNPWSFAGQEDDGATWFWGKGNIGSSHNTTYNKDEDSIKPLIESLNKKFYANGVPVILGEYSAQWREIGDEQAIHDNSVKAWFKEVTAQSINNCWYSDCDNINTYSFFCYLFSFITNPTTCFIPVSLISSDLLLCLTPEESYLLPASYPL